MNLELLEQRKDTLKAQRGTGWSMMTVWDGSSSWTEREKRAWRGERKKAGAGANLLAKESFKSQVVSTGCTCWYYGARYSEKLWDRIGMIFISQFCSAPLISLERSEQVPAAWQGLGPGHQCTARQDRGTLPPVNEALCWEPPRMCSDAVYVSLLRRRIIHSGEIFPYRWASDIFVVTQEFC